MVGKIITITSGKGGVGKSTMSVNIGKGFSNLGYKVLLIDLDIGLKNLDILLNVTEEPKYDFIDLMNNEVSIENSSVKIENNLYYLSASQKYDKTYLDENKINNLLINLKRSFDIILIDSPAGIESGFIHSIEISDEIILVVNTDMTSIRDADRVQGLIQVHNKNIKNDFEVNISLVINKYPRDDVNNITHADIQKILNVDLYGIIPYSESMMYYYNNGIPAIENNLFLNNMVKRLEKKIIFDEFHKDIMKEIPINFDLILKDDDIEIYKKIQKAQKKVINNLEETLLKNNINKENLLIEIKLLKNNNIINDNNQKEFTGFKELKELKENNKLLNEKNSIVNKENEKLLNDNNKINKVYKKKIIMKDKKIKNLKITIFLLVFSLISILIYIFFEFYIKNYGGM